MRATVSEPLEPSKAPRTESARDVTLTPRICSGSAMVTSVGDVFSL
jgi:hypothetical protein